MKSCYFCQSIDQKSGLHFIPELETDLFVVAWDANPATAGHALVIPKHHAQYMKELGFDERQSLLETVLTAKKYIQNVDLLNIYKQMVKELNGTKSEEFIKQAISKLEDFARAPEDFNDGLNDGPTAGQTVPHFHWHILPRWHGDTEDPRGGIRHMFTGMGNYHQGIVRDN